MPGSHFTQAMKMSERIDLTQIEAFLESAGLEAGGTVVYDLIAELKKMYAREDELLDALRIIRDDLQEARAYGAYTLAQSEKLRKIRNFAHDASQ